MTVSYDHNKPVDLAHHVVKATHLLKEHSNSGAISVTCTNSDGITYTVEAAWSDEEPDDTDEG